MMETRNIWTNLIILSLFEQNHLMIHINQYSVFRVSVRFSHELNSTFFLIFQGNSWYAHLHTYIGLIFFRFGNIIKFIYVEYVFNCIISLAYVYATSWNV